MNWNLKAKLCLAKKSKLMKATLVAGGKENAGAVLQAKIPVFGLSLPDSGLFANHEKVKRGGKVYTKIIPDASGATLIPIIKRKVVPASR